MYQDAVDSGCANRATADISADADPSSGLAIYNTLDEGWEQVGGTSLSVSADRRDVRAGRAPLTPARTPYTYPYAHRGSRPLRPHRRH